MLLIATDEAGYGPKLGPLVVAASAWQVPTEPTNPGELQNAFSAVAQPVRVDGRRIVVNDSKAVFKPQSANKSSSGKSSDGYGKLECVTLAGARWCEMANEHLNLVSHLAPQDQGSIAGTAWLKGLLGQSIDTGAAGPLVTAWQSGPAQLAGMKARVITAAAFNRSCRGGANKSDLLSQTTLELVKSLLDELAIAPDEQVPDEQVTVYCDRHGGRRYYAGPLQAVFDGTLVRVIAESKDESCYAVPYRGGEFTIRFTVKGDSFTPVAFSSMVAKYVREKAMESFNAYFADLAPQPLRPTAGYPVDADRFLKDIEAIVREQNIDLATLVRSR